MAEEARPDEAAPRTAVPSSEPAGLLWDRVRDHKIIQWGIAYLGAALALGQGAELLGDAFQWPELVGRVLLILLVAGFPIASLASFDQQGSLARDRDRRHPHGSRHDRLDAVR
jgi:hypothetical protein